MSKKTETKKDKKAEKKTETPTTSILDKLLEAGGTLEDIAKAAAAEQEKRQGNRYKTPAGILAHMQARASKKKEPVVYNVDPSKEIKPDEFVQVVQ